MFSELSLLREDTVRRTPKLVLLKYEDTDQKVGPSPVTRCLSPRQSAQGPDFTEQQINSHVNFIVEILPNAKN